MTGARAAVPVFLNQSAGTRATTAASLQQQLGERARVELVPVALLADRLRAEVSAGTEAVGVAGGDGTLRAAAAVLAGTGTALLCIPTGTLNHFARRIGIPDMRAAAAALADLRIETVPTGRAISAAQTEVLFLNTLTFGEYSRVVRIRERYRRFIGKWPAAGAAFFAALVTMRRLRITVHTGSASLVRRTPFVWVGIGWGSFPRVHEAPERRTRPDLEVAIARPGSVAAGAAFLFRLGLSMLRGSELRQDPGLELLNTRSLVVDAHHRIDITADGEPDRLRPPVSISLEDQALLVVAGP